MNKNKREQKENTTQFVHSKEKSSKKSTRNINITASDDKTYSTICYVHLAQMLYIRLPVRLLTLFLIYTGCNSLFKMPA